MICTVNYGVLRLIFYLIVATPRLSFFFMKVDSTQILEV